VTFPASGTAFPTYDPNCTDTSSSGNCPIYPGVAQMGFLGTSPHGFREITGLDMTLGNGIFQGYRWYDKHGVTPMYAFGHGLSYTTFAYSNLTRTPRGDGTVLVTVDVTNTGDVRGDEVVMAYVSAGPPVAGVQQAVRSLRGFERIAVDPGQTKRVMMTLDRRSFEYWSAAQHAWVYNAGPRTLTVGGLSTQVLAPSIEQDAGGTVPGTLSLTLGPPASFGAFTPGVARDYLATTAATVISTAGEATLSVADPDDTHTGFLKHASEPRWLAQPLQARIGTGAFGPIGSAAAPLALLSYTGPVSNAPATIELRQSIGATEPLRTGRYGKTLTFTLSTTTP
jgi:beta-glucosidase